MRARARAPRAFEKRRLSPARISRPPPSSPPPRYLRIIDGKQRRLFVTVAVSPADDFTLRFRTAERRRGNVCAPPPPPPEWGARRRFSRPAEETRETPRTAHAPVAQLVRVRGGGSSTDGARIKAPPAPPYPFLRPAARGGWLLVGALSRRGRECTDHTRGGVPLSPPSLPLLSAATPLPPSAFPSRSLSRSPSSSHRLDVFVCL